MKISVIKIFGSLSLALVVLSAKLMAVDALPKGVGAYGYAIREYDTESEQFDAEGNRQSLGAAYSKNFDGRSLLQGAGGPELQKLAEQLKKFDANSSDPNSLVNTLKLGRLDVQVEGHVQAQAFATGFGITNSLTWFGVVPWVTASVNSSFNYINDNNIPEIRQRVGDLAFEELKSGFDKAQNINTQQILDGLRVMGYDNLDHWSYDGLGDIMTGFIYSKTFDLNRDLKTGQSWRTTLRLPTGYYDDPDVINDVSIGKGYYVISNTYNPSLSIQKIKIGMELSYGYGVPTSVEKRVPEGDENLVAPDRKTSVNLEPGADKEIATTVSYENWHIKPGYTIGLELHDRDFYSGSMPGNYDKLGQGSDTSELYQEPKLGFETVELYRQKRFPVPIMGEIKAHLPISGTNIVEQKYFQFVIGSFFSTPIASTTTQEAKNKSNTPSSTNRSSIRRH